MGANIRNGQLLTDSGDPATTIHVLDPERGGFAAKGDIGESALVRFVAAAADEDPGGHYLQVAELRGEWQEWAVNYLDESGWLSPFLQWMGEEGRAWLGWGLEPQ